MCPGGSIASRQVHACILQKGLKAWFARNTDLDSEANRAAQRGRLPAPPHADCLPSILSSCGVPEQAAL